MKTTKKWLLIPAALLVISTALGGAMALRKATKVRSKNAPMPSIHTPAPTAPASVNGDAVDTLGAVVSYLNFTTASTLWKTQHPGATFGGRIGKATLQTIINSMTPENKFVNFYFASDNGSTYIIFIPSGLRVDGSIYKNTGYCPSFCSNN